MIMATQLQRAFGLASGKQEVPKGSEPKSPKKDRADKKSNGKADPFDNLPRRLLAVDQEG